MGEANKKLPKEGNHHPKGMLIPELPVEVGKYTIRWRVNVEFN